MPLKLKMCPDLGATVEYFGITYAARLIDECWCFEDEQGDVGPFFSQWRVRVIGPYPSRDIVMPSETVLLAVRVLNALTLGLTPDPEDTARLNAFDYPRQNGLPLRERAMSVLRNAAGASDQRQSSSTNAPGRL